VRELENRVKRAVVMADGREITAEDLELADVEVRQTPFDLREVRELAEMQAIKRAIHHADRNLSRAAELLGITRPTLYNLMKKYKIPN
jgi:two-component system NtrC family response regulator